MASRMQAPMIAMIDCQIQPPGGTTPRRRRMKFSSSAPTMPTMMLPSTPMSFFMISSAIHPAIPPRMIVMIQPTPSIAASLSAPHRRGGSNVYDLTVSVKDALVHHLRQGRMREHGVHQFRLGRLQVHGDHEALDEFRHLRTDHVRAEEFAGLH